MKKLKYPTCLLVSILLMGCSRSLVYSPLVSILKKDVKKGEWHVSSGLTILTETNPGYDYAPLGTQLKLGYGFSDRINVFMSGWMDLERNQEFIRGGASIASRIIIRNNEKSSFQVIPKIGFVTEGNQIGGYGAGVDLIYTNDFGRLFYYLGAGPIAGQINQGQNFTFGNNVLSGYGFTGHLGLGYKITAQLRMLLEINPVVQHNRFNEDYSFQITPSLTFGYVLN